MRGGGRQRDTGGRTRSKVRKGDRKYKAKLKKNHHQQNSISMLTRMDTSSNVSNESVILLKKIYIFFFSLSASDSVKSPEHRFSQRKCATKQHCICTYCTRVQTEITQHKQWGSEAPVGNATDTVLLVEHQFTIHTISSLWNVQTFCKNYGIQAVFTSTLSCCAQAKKCSFFHPRPITGLSEVKSG